MLNQCGHEPATFSQMAEYTRLAAGDVGTERGDSQTPVTEDAPPLHYSSAVMP